MQTTLTGKRIIIGVTGSIAAFKVAGWVSNLSKEEARVAVIMTDSACRFVTPLTFAALSGERVYTDLLPGRTPRPSLISSWPARLICWSLPRRPPIPLPAWHMVWPMIC